MALFTPRTDAYWTAVGSYDQYGQQIAGARLPVRVGVVKFLDAVISTPLRMEMSASHGRMDEDVVQAAILLFPMTCNIATDDVVEIFGTTLQVTGVWPQQDVLGKFQHKRVTLKRSR